MKESERPAVHCPDCKTKLFDGEVIKGVSVLKVLHTGSEGMCKRCKAWVRLPIGYAPRGITIEEAIDGSLLTRPRKLASGT